MAVDKLVDSTQLDSDLTSVANAIRTKGGTSAQLAFPAGFVSAVQAIPTGVTPTGTKNISITANGVTTEDVTNYASAQITANVPNTYSAGDEGKVVSNGALVAQGSDTVTQNDTYDTTLISSLIVNVSGGGGANLDWIASASPTPSVRNFFNALKTGNYEHGEVSFANTPNTFHDFFTCQNITNLQGFIIIDKAFYHQGGTTVNSGAQAILFLWSDKSFTNSVAAGQSATKWGAIECSVNYANATVAQCLAGNYINLDGSVAMLQGSYKWDAETKTLQTKSAYSNNTQYTNLLRNRTYIWIAY